MNNGQKNFLKVMGASLMLLYPFLVFFVLYKNLPLNILALILGCVVLTHFVRLRNKILLAIGTILCTLICVFHNPVFIKIYPVIMNTFFFILFAGSLKTKPIITYFAEQKLGKLNTKDKEYTKKATIAWSIFLFITIVLSSITLFMSDFIWTIYNGLIAYILIGIMFIGEIIIRKQHANQ